MRWTAPLIVLLALGMLSFYPSLLAGSESAPTRLVDVDIRPTINMPGQGEKLEAELGLRINVTLDNLGTEDANNTGTLTLTITNSISGQVVFNPFAVSFNNITAGGSKYVLFSNWSTAKPGTYHAEVYSIYAGDANTSNNRAEVDFSMLSSNWTEKPRFKSYSLDPPKGNTSTNFLYKVEYVYNKLPDVVRVEIDGTNHTMTEENELDEIPEDGKFYLYSTTLPPGNHVFRFFGEVEDRIIGIPSGGNLSIGPWVNVTLRNPVLNPKSGYVTSNFNLKINYGSIKDLPPDEIYAMIGNNRVDLKQFSPSAIYTSGNVEFSAQVLGLDILPSPLSITYHCSVDGDEIVIGPFVYQGPSMEKTTMTGTVKDTKGSPIEGAAISLVPGPSTTSGADGSYSIEAYVGRSYSLLCTKEGFYNKTYTGSIDLYSGEVRRIDIEMAPLPEGVRVSGWVSGSFDGVTEPLQGAFIGLAGSEFTGTTSTDEDGFYEFTDVPPSGLHVLNFTAPYHQSREKDVMIREGDSIIVNMTLFELPMNIRLIPHPDAGDIPVDSLFTLTFPSPVNISSVNTALRGKDADVGTTMVLDSNMTSVSIHPRKNLMFNSDYELLLDPGVISTGSKVLVWRPIIWSFHTEKQDLGRITTFPAPDSRDLPVNISLEITFGIALNMSTFAHSLMVRNPVEIPIDTSIEYRLLVDNDDSGRTVTKITIDPASDLLYGKSYVLIVNRTVRDAYGRSVLQENLILEFSTTAEPDSDGDGVLDSNDAFPNDPAASVDSDGDGYPDEWNPGYNGSLINPDLYLDAFPNDPSAWRDTDGDGKPDFLVGESTTGLVKDDDSDGDGMDDEWEILYGLDPYDSSDAYIDTDGDGRFNIDEYIDGTDPTDESSVKKDELDNGYLILTAVIIIILVIIAGTVIFFVLKGRAGPREHEE
ncbi:MAG: carboxypeptidase regulatory-like domain-containing protein [Thermoplasmatota archaeon]